MSEIQHLETFEATAEGKGWPTTVKITGTEWTVQVDEPVDDGGSNTGPNPMQYFVASLASCQNEQAQVVAEELSLDISQIDMTLEVDLNLDGFMGVQDHSKECFRRVSMVTSVQGGLTSEQVSQLGEKVDNRCPILSLLRSSGAEISSTWSKA